MPQAVVTSQSAAERSYHYLDLGTPLQSDCTVSGALSFVLHLSRIATVAPIKFEKVRGGWRISLSRFYYAYTILSKIILYTFTAISTFDTREDLIDGYEPSSNTRFMSIVTKISWSLETCTGLLIAVTGYKRMYHMINCLISLEQINKEFDHLYLPSCHSVIKTWFKIIFLLIFGYLGAFMDYGIYIYDVIAANGKVPFAAIPGIISSINIIHVQLLSIQVNLVIMRLVSTQQRLNICLKSLLEELRKDSSPSSFNGGHPKYETNAKETRVNMLNPISYSVIKLYKPSAVRGSKINPALLRHLINIYCSLCHMVRLLNEGNGIAIMMLLLYSTVALVVGPYFVVTVLFRTQSEVPLFKVLCLVWWYTLCYVMLLTVTEPCHRAHFQLRRTKYLVTRLMRHTPRDDSAVYHELKMFRCHISLNPVRFHSIHLLKFDRNLSIAVLTVAVTYLSVVINL